MSTCGKIQRVGGESDRASSGGAELFCSRSIWRFVFGEGGRRHSLRVRGGADADGRDGRGKKRKIWRMTHARPH